MDVSSGDVEHEHVHKVYSQIASHFSDTRFKPWPKIAQFLREQPTASLIADVGKKAVKVMATCAPVFTTARLWEWQVPWSQSFRILPWIRYLSRVGLHSW